MTNAFVNDLKAMCGALLHALWKIERSEDPNVIPLDLARDILSYLGSFREHEVIMKELVAAEELKDPDGNNANDDPSHIPTEPTESVSVEDDKAVDQSVNEEQKIAVNATLNSVDEVNASEDLKITENERIAEEQPSSANDDIVIEEKPHTIDEKIVPITVNDTSHTLALLTHAIGQLEGDMAEKNRTIDEENIQNEPPEAAVQALNVEASEIVVTTTQYEEESVELKRSKRKPKPKEEMEKFLKRRRSADFRLLNNDTISKLDISSSNDDDIEKDSKAAVPIADFKSEERVMKMMKKRQSKLRQTICVQPPDIEVDEEELFSIRKNTDIQMYVTNGDYHKKRCEICKKSQSHLVPHFVRAHPEYEVPISRPSPTMAKQLRQQGQTFTQFQGKLTGLCWFCEESKSLPKYRWVAHFLVHTGENMFVCNTCDKTYKTKSDHNTCEEEAVNIHYTNAEERSIMGFICKDCNHTQLFRGNMIKHLKNEHGYIGPDENYHYKQVQLVPDLERFKPSSKK